MFEKSKCVAFSTQFSINVSLNQRNYSNRGKKIFQHRCNLLADMLNFVYTSVHILYLGQVPKEGGR